MFFFIFYKNVGVLMENIGVYRRLSRDCGIFVNFSVVFFIRITKQLMEQDGPDWREKLPEIPNVPISAQQHRREEPSAEVLQARAARAEEEKGSSLAHTHTHHRLPHKHHISSH